ncbi:hypothetical protein D3C75_1173730 [compost metagenome]
MRRVDPIVTGGGVKQHRRVGHSGFDIVIRREGFDVGPFFRLARVAIFGNPGGTGGKLGIALHIQQRHFTDDAAEKLRVQRQHIAHQQATVTATPRAQML